MLSGLDVPEVEEVEPLVGVLARQRLGVRQACLEVRIEMPNEEEDMQKVRDAVAAWASSPQATDAILETFGMIIHNLIFAVTSHKY